MLSLVDTDIRTVTPATVDPEITGLTADSRQVQPGFLFAALPGARTDGQRFVGDALARGAAALLLPAGEAQPIAADVAGPAAILQAANPRGALARIAARFYGSQPRVVAAVTGTNGKTSVACFTRQLWQLLGHKAASLGTLGIMGPGVERAGALTTPDPVLLHQLLAELAGAGFDHLAMEASSHGLDQCRLDGVRIAAAAFTNLSRDHLDYHGSFEAYFAAKRRLFEERVADGGAAVLNADVPEFAPLRTVAARRGLRVIDYGRNAAAVRLIDASPLADGQSLTLALNGRTASVALPLVGTFQAMNALAALGLVLAEGAGADAAVAALERLAGVPGRLQHAATRRSGGAVYVDYAHTPDALETVLAALRPHARGRLMVVFGCGGDRDAGKRPQMGAIAARLADQAIVTDDNPRSEDPAAIRRAILAACPGAREIGARGEAIRAAVAALAAGDVLVIAGKGHERGQIVGATVHPFDDVEVARAAVLAADGGAA